MSRFLLAALALCGAAIAQIETTPYDLIRPVWPLTWDPTILDTYVPGVRQNSVPANRTPQDYTPNAYVPDTLNQAYLDAINLRISPIRLNQAGYLPSDPEKLIYYVGTASTFEVVDAAGTVVGTGTFTETGTNTQSSYKVVAGINAQRNMNIRYTAEAAGPSGSLRKGSLPSGLPLEQRLRVRVGTDYSATFVISERIYSMVRDATLKFYGINRSGDSESWFHPPSHTLDGSGRLVDRGGTQIRIAGNPGALSGGWYDCGDHLKESQTQAYAFMVLSVMSAALADRDEDNYAYNHAEVHNTDGIPDLLREARHGADFVLKAYDFANGVIDDMPLSVGNFGADHGWWGRPENQDYIPASVTGRGGPHERDLRLGELGSNISGQYAAGLALLSVHYRRYDPVFADKALRVAQELYTFAKQLALGQITPTNNREPSAWSSAAYNGNNEHHDDLGLAAIALLYATRDTLYLYDAVENPQMRGGQTKNDFIGNMGGAGTFRGGWFTVKTATLLKDVKNTSWANAYAFTLYAFYKLILATETQAAQFGIPNARRLGYIEDVVLTMAANLGDMGRGSATIVLPNGVIMWKQHQAQYDPIWFKMHTDQTWIYNRYQAGNIFEVLAYADVAKDLEGVQLPNVGVRPWRSTEMRQLGINQMNYMLGLNPWDMSWLLGVGDKHDAHPHHRGANPEGKNVPGADYRYRPPTGAVFGGIPPDEQPGNALAPASLSWEDYHLSETCIDGTASFIAPAVILAKQEDLNRAPLAAVEIRYVGFDSAIVVVRQDMFGPASIQYGTDPAQLNQVAQSTGSGVMHTFVLKPLANGTTYFFTATSVNERSGNPSVRYLVDSTQTPYTFTTLATPPANADIQNVKVCNVSADSAEIMWFTPNGEYESKIYWDTVLTSYQNMRWSQSGDVAGVPTRFHYMKIGGLQERTTYYYAVESNGVVRSVDENNLPLQFRTPVTQYDFAVRSSQYAWGGMTALELNIYNNEARPFDSLTLRVYMRGTDALARDIGIRMDICQAYNEAGFNNACSPATITELTGLFRVTFPVKLEDTYNPGDGTWQWYFPIPLGSTVIRSSSRMRLDVAFDRRSPWAPYLDLMNQAPDKKLFCQTNAGTQWFSPERGVGAALPANPGDWSWMPHSRTGGDPVNYIGLPCEVKDFGDADLAPINPYIVVYRKDEFVWGYSPSRSEQITKRSNYKITTTLQAPFDVSNGSYLELDAGGSTLYVRGTAKITERGEVTDIWVNGARVADVASAAVYNPTTDMFDLNIPVRLGIGANKVDVTIFAGPSLSCAECQLNGGCAFVNHNFFVQFSRGNLTASSLTLTDVATQGPVVSPAVPGELSFHITVRDEDKARSRPATVPVLVINANKGDTLRVNLALDALTGLYRSSAPITAVARDAAATTGNEIAFFGGDTIWVRYIDPDDEEDISQQSFFSTPSFPDLASARILDTDCDGAPDVLHLRFSQSFGDGDRMDSIWVVLRNPSQSLADSFFVYNTQPIANITELVLNLPAANAGAMGGAPTGSVSAYIQPTGSPTSQISRTALTDGIAPRLVGVSLLENPNQAEPFDTVMISYSEPVSLQSRSVWPLAISNAGAPVNTAGLVVQGQATTTNNGQSWLYVVAGNAGGLLLDSGYTASVAPTFQVTDNALNTLDDATCPDLVSVAEVPKPVPVKVAIFKDRDQDGSPDMLYMEFERQLRDKDMLDSFVTQWGNPPLRRVFSPAIARQWQLSEVTSQRMEAQMDADGSPLLNPDSTPVMAAVTDTRSVIEIPFDNTLFPLGTTHGHRNGRGTVVPRLGPLGGFFDREYSITDSVGPVITVARLNAVTSSMENLVVAISEPVDTLSAFFVERRRGAQVATLTPSLTRRGGLNDSLFELVFTQEVVGTVKVGDFVRLIAYAPSVVDRAGIAPPANAPWIPVRGSMSSDINFRISLQNTVGGRDTLAMRTGYSQDIPDSDDHFRLTVVNPRVGQEVKLAEGTGSLLPANSEVVYDTATYKHLGPTFEIEISLPGAFSHQNGSPVWQYRTEMQVDLFDNLGSFVNRTSFAFSLDQIDDTYLNDDGSLILRLEWLNHDRKSPKAKDGRLMASGAYIALFQMKAVGVALQDDEGAQDLGGDPNARPQFVAGTVRKGNTSVHRTFGVLRRR